MNQEKTSTLSGYKTSLEEAQHLVLTWVKATEAFHYRYTQLTRIIDTLEKSASYQSVSKRSKLHRLQKLRQQSADVLVTLLMDMSEKKTKSQPSHHGQLHSHACLLNEQTQKIDVELIGMTTVAQA